MKFICALITVEDIERSKAFYQNVLNQKIKFDYGENVFFEGDFAIHLKSHFQNLINGKEIKSYSNAFELYFETDSLALIENKLLTAISLWQIGLLFPLIAVVLLIIANIFIKKDEKLVKSSDRLR